MACWKWIGRMGLAVLVLPACGGDGTDPGDPGDFIADNPFAHGDPGDGEGLTGTGAGESGGQGEDGGGDPGSDDDNGGGEDGEREIAEADIIQIEGDRLYALSQYGGLTVIDISTPDAFPVLGRFRANAQPFEMYVDNGQVFVMYRSLGRYEIDEATGYYTWRTESSLMALDARDPANIRTAGEFGLPGDIQDSRRVGDVLYLVTYEDGWCWGCEEGVSQTVVTSLDVADETNVQQIDRLRFVDPTSDEGWWWGGPRSVSATDERIYIAGREYDDSWESGHSIIDVVDISDPGGDLVPGTKVQVAGQIDSRWQMDEHEGVLRVVSQPGWGGAVTPVIETFSVASAQDIVPLGSLAMTLPRPETLQSVRFDGTRGYAITFEQTDPLFTLDLSDPAHPQQVGELEIPGWVYHMEPRGDRLIGIGFDNTNPEGALNVSLFDVSDFANPTMLSRVHFGGDWGGFAEDQNRIHKSFQILDELGLLLVPFHGWHSFDEWGCNGSYQSGIQLVDWREDALALRGVAPSHGQARRALVHDGRLLAISDLAVESFDIADRDAPQETASLPLATNVTGMALGDGVIVRLSADWWTDQTLLEIADAADPETAEALGRLHLDEVIPKQDPGEVGCWYYGWYDPEIFVRSGFVYLVRERYDYYDGDDGSMAIDVIDIRDPFAPAYVETLELPFSRGWGYGPHLTNDEKSIVLVGDKLVLQSREHDWTDDGLYARSNGTFEVVDLADPAHPVHAGSLPRPEGLAHGGLQVFDGVVVSWHMRAANADASKVRFYLDRLYAPSGTAAKLAQPVNVPGAVAAWDESSRRAVVVDYQLGRTLVDDEQCGSHPRSIWWYDPSGNGACRLAQRDVHLVRVDGDAARLLDTVSLEGDDAALRGAAASDDRLFVHLQRGSYAWEEDGGVTELPSAEVTVFSDWRSNTLEPAATVTVPGESSWLSDLHALGSRLVFRAGYGLGEVDAADARAPSVEVHDLFGYYCYDLDADADTAYCAMGEFGLQTVALGQ